MDLASLPCTQLKGVGTHTAERLANCGIVTVQDLLFHLPYRYQDRTRIYPINQLQQGDHAVTEGIIENVEVKQRHRPMLLCYLNDGTGEILLRFFYFTNAQKMNLAIGTRLRCFGEVRNWMGTLEMIHPEYRRIQQNSIVPVEENLTPIYSTTEGLNQRSLRMLTDQALTLLNKDTCLNEFLPHNVLKNFKLPSLAASLKYVHRPPRDAKIDLLENGAHPAQKRLAFEELLAHQLSLKRLRLTIQFNPAPAFESKNNLSETFLSSLPFSLTNAQQKVIREIHCDMEKSVPMLRLIQGDVGSGKTLIAALAALRCVENHFQAVMMAPTELLSDQHFQNFTRWFGSLGIKVVHLSGKLKSKIKNETLASIASGEAQIILGTHALFQENVQFSRLGLVIIDEQHRFGVQQRLALKEKGVQNGFYPHQLIMTATPIPRTLAMTVYADLDISMIDELPPGRKPIMTLVKPNTRRDEMLDKVKQAFREQRQVYWVCTLIEESELLQCQAAEATAQVLQEALPDISVGLVHGRLKPAEKETMMQDFKHGKINLLVATTVIEVGVDVPNASLMVIENAERLGLAQLHQLRGRIGRGTAESHCVLMYQYPLSQLAKARLAIMRQSQDGFEIARRDLELRGPGEVLGTRQTGDIRMRIADLLRDQRLLPKISEAANLLLKEYPNHVDPLVRRWLGMTERYAKV